MGVRHGVGAKRNAAMVADASPPRPLRRGGVTMAGPGNLGRGTAVDTPNAPALAATSAPPSRWRAIFIVLLINAVPIAGVLYYEWSATNVLVLYWFENLMIAIATSLRIIAHRMLTRKRGHWRRGTIGGINVNEKPVKSTLLTEYALVAFVFTLAHGLFVGVIAYMLTTEHPDDPMWQFSWPQLERGIAAIGVMMGIELLVDIATMRSRPFAWIKEYAQRRMSRILVLHLAIIFGMLAMAMTNSPFGILYVLIGLKTLVDLGGALSQGMKAPDPGAPPPAWALRFADKVGKDKGGSADLLKHWNEQTAREQRDAIEDEEVVR
jgi:uncharacterized protein DUF6498